MRCTACGGENEPGRKFCGECGARLEAPCASCGASNPPTVKFCGECGARLVEVETAGTAPAPALREAPTAERRLVSVLFADLVGFTTLSERRDAEEVRELLSRYFDEARRVIGRYGGAVEKFIGDAVMAVWGAPVANEDDAERAVRAGLDLVAAVSALGEDLGAPGLRARAGVLTGEAAVAIGAEGQGMVAGDLVNTASRVQAAAEPGTVLVGDSTHRATEAAIVYEDAGVHELKGKAEPVPLWRAVRVVALRGGAVKTTGLEPPFVGRDRELRLIKELFHTTADERRAHLVSVVGIGGIGKSRLSWEFEKYIDGLAVDAWWHRGRCLAYGDGVAFWALAEMIRMRAGILEDEEPASASAKLRAAVDEHVPDANERRFVEPRLAHLLGLEDRGADQENLFSAWRLLFERMAEVLPVVLVFEDIHWADSALLDFVEYVLDWSREHPIFILTLARPELADRRPTWGAGKRAFTSLFLDPLPPEAMEVLLTGPVPGLPDDLRTRILERAEGVPFYAVETVRMLLDRGLLVREGNAYRPAGEIETLEVPETLQALIAARLDGLAQEERRLLQDASVLGRTFTVQGLVAMTGLGETDLEPLLVPLVRKEVLSITTDPLSPERGQYGFLQDLVKKVAYETMSRKERRARHLAAAAHLLAAADEDEVVEIVAAHLLDAYRAAPEEPDAHEVKARARDALARAGERAASLGANAEAQRLFEQAAQLADDPLVEAGLAEQAGMMAEAGGRGDQAAVLFERSFALLEQHGQMHSAARVSARIGELMWNRGRAAEAIERMDRSFQVLAGEEPDEDLAVLAAQLGRFLFFSGEVETAVERIEVALEIAEAHDLPDVLSQALNTKGITLVARERLREGLVLLRYALDVAVQNEIPSAALRAYYNLADATIHAGASHEGHEHVLNGLALSRRVGNRVWEWSFLGQVYPLLVVGDWDEVLLMASAIPEEAAEQVRAAMICFLANTPFIHLHRGELEEAKHAHARFAAAAGSDDVQELAAFALGEALLARADGRLEDALALALRAFEHRNELGVGSESVREAFVAAVEAALDLGETETVRRLVGIVESLPRGRRPQFLEAHARRIRARLASVEGDIVAAGQGFRRSSAMFRELETPFWLAVVLLEQGEWLVAQSRPEDAVTLLQDAREIFERLRARPWLERLDRAAEPAVAAS
jgi:class 3 adenylate cyclase/tetratricopeptide (TPR) repeat protein